MTNNAAAPTQVVSPPKPMQLLRYIIVQMKPKIILLLAITAAAGYGVATKGNADLFHLGTFCAMLIGLSLSAGGANMVNMWYDADIDGLMLRTRMRPIPQGLMAKSNVLYWGIGLGVFSFGWLWLFVNLNTALACAAGYLFYAIVYTMWLKRNTVQNIVIGGAAGAFPPLVGWAAVQNTLCDPLPWGMFAVVFFWTPPHFWALALMVNMDYTKAGVPMLPVKRGVQETKAQMLYYQLFLIPVTLALALSAPLGWLYLAGATILNSWWLYYTVKLWREGGITTARKVFNVSLYYLAALFALMVLDCFV